MYVVTRKGHTRVSEEQDPEVSQVETEHFEPGEEIEPTEAELSSFPDRFEEVPEGN